MIGKIIIYIRNRTPSRFTLHLPVITKVKAPHCNEMLESKEPVLLTLEAEICMSIGNFKFLNGLQA
jgi:hypothetical protein